MNSKIELFCCSAIEDELFREKLEKHLQIFQRYGLIDALWNSQNIIPGTEVDQGINKYLNISQIIILFISPDFLSSDNCYRIMLQAMDRHKKGNARVIPIILRPVDWKDAPLGKLKALPTNEKPLTLWSNVDEALYDVAAGIRQAIELWKDETASYPPTIIKKTSSAKMAPKTLKKFSFRLVRTLVEHLGPIACVTFSSDGELLLSDSWDNTIKIWNNDAGSILSTLKGHSKTVYSVGFSPDARTIISGSDDCTIKIWETQTGRELRVLTGHKGPVSSVALSAGIIVSGSDDCTIRIWDIETGNAIRVLTDHNGPVSSVALSANAKTLVSGSYDKTIKVWDIESGQVQRTLIGHNGPVSSVALSANAKTLVSGSYDKTIKVWDIRSGRERRTLIGHNGPVSSIALSPNTKVLVSGSHDTTIKLWKTARGQLLDELTGHTEAVLSVAFHPNGTTIASGGLDKTIKIWQKSPVSTERVKNIHVVIGDTGNSDYLAALVHQIQKKWTTPTNGPIQATCLNPELANTYMRRYSDLPAIHELNSTSSLAYQLLIKKPANQVPTTINLFLSEYTGENLSSTDELLKHSIIQLDGIIVLVDPLNMSEIRSQLPAHVFSSVSTPVLNVNLSNEIYHMIGRASQGKKADAPVAIVLSKSDLLRFLPLKRIGHIKQASSDDGVLDLDTFSKIDQEVRYLLNAYNEHLLLRLARGANAQFFVASTTGYSPNQTDHYLSLSEPHRCLDPLLWLLYQLGIIELGDAK